MSTSELPRINAPTRSAGSLPFSPARQDFGNGSSPWSDEAPSKVVTQFLSGDERAAWRTWKKHLARRKSAWADTRLEKISRADVVQWGCCDHQLDEPTRSAIDALFDDGKALSDARQRALEVILAEGARSLDAQNALLHLSCAYALPALAATVPQRQWGELLGRLVQTARDAAVLDLTSTPLLQQWLAGELPVALAALLPELTVCAELLPQGRQALSAGMEELLDGEGTPQRRYLDIQWPLVACWTRVRATTASLREPCWDDAAEAQYPFAVREMLRLADYRGGSLFVDSPASDRKRLAQFFAAAVKLSDDKGNRAALSSLGWRNFKATKRGAKKRVPAAPNHSEWAQVACLRSAWEQSSPRLGIAYGERNFRGEFSSGRARLFSGDWPFAVMVDGRVAAPVEDWEPVCWVSDDDVDYLELEIDLEEGLKLQRQLCLAKKDRFLLVADAVLGRCARSLCHSLCVPLAREVEAVLAEDSREVRLRAAETKALVFPLSLPEWRVDRRIGELSAGPGHLELQQKATVASMYAPLWIDLDPDRQRKPFTWRQLTVAEERRIVPRDVAVGYRVQFGNKQWIIYRSLTPPRNRTVLGHNLATDFLIARFDRDGSVRGLIEVE